jgi:hypothetical protein
LFGGQELVLCPRRTGLDKFCTLMEVKVKVTLEQAIKARRGSAGIALRFL